MSSGLVARLRDPHLDLSDENIVRVLLADSADAIERLVRERDEADVAAKRWYEAASPYATPEALSAAMGEEG